MHSHLSLLFRTAIASVLLALLSCGASAAPPQRLGLQPVVSGFASPVTVANAGDGSNRLFVIEQVGRIKIVSGKQVLATPFLDITAKVLFDGGERGLLGLAFDANYTTNGFFYVYYTHQAGGQFTTGMITISRYKVSADPNVADASSESVLITQDHPTNANHNGGALLWGPDDGCLYAGVGDGGGGGDVPNNAQNLGILLGKLIRIKPTDGSACTGNPFIGTPGARPEIWALGLRNPWRITFDRQTHDLLIADVGQGTEEEIDFQPAGSLGGQNYRWSCMEGLLPFNTSISCTIGTATNPVLVYDHVNGNCAVIGGYRYRGSRFPALAGTYIYGDLCTGQIWGGVQSGNTWTSSPLLLTGFTISSFGEDESGEVYLLQYSGNATLYRLVLLQLPGTHDFNGDSDSDLLLRNTGGGIAMWLMNSSAAIQSAVGVGSATNDWVIVGQRDLNGDGTHDILFRNTNGSVAAWLVNAATVTSAVGLGAPGTAWNIAGTGDFNRDGIGDILFRGGTSVAIWFMNSSGTIGSAVGVGSLETDWTVAGTGDFDGDGICDILWYNTTVGGVAVWLMNSNGTLKSAVGVGSLPVGSWSIAGTGDFNGDGIGDILLLGGGTSVAIWFINSSGMIGSVQGVGTMASGWTIAQTGDFNRDGKSDILWYNGASGGIGAWLMNGATVTSAVGIGSLPPASWSIVTANGD